MEGEAAAVAAACAGAAPPRPGASRRRLLLPAFRACSSLSLHCCFLQPRVYLYHNFMSDEECDHIIKVGGARGRRRVEGWRWHTAGRAAAPRAALPRPLAAPRTFAQIAMPHIARSSVVNPDGSQGEDTSERRGRGEERDGGWARALGGWGPCGLLHGAAAPN